MQGELIVPLVWGVLIGLVSVIAFGVPASAVFGNAGDSVVGWIMLVLILVCGAIGGCVALVPRHTKRLASDLEPDNLVGRAPFGSPIRRERVHDPQTASVDLVLCRRALHGTTTSLVFYFDSHPVGIRMDGQANHASGMDGGVGHELADQQLRQLDDGSLHTVVGENVACEGASLANARGLAEKLDCPGHRLPTYPEHSSRTPVMSR
jgi:hypothetical protein